PIPRGGVDRVSAGGGQIHRTGSARTPVAAETSSLLNLDKRVTLVKSVKVASAPFFVFLARLVPTRKTLLFLLPFACCAGVFPRLWHPLCYRQSIHQRFFERTKTRLSGVSKDGGDDELHHPRTPGAATRRNRGEALQP